MGESQVLAFPSMEADRQQRKHVTRLRREGKREIQHLVELLTVLISSASRVAGL